MLLALWSCSAGDSERGALAVEATLLAPCCFNGTLVTHESDLARTLRAEIEERVAHGESAAAIRANMVERYGTKVLAMPNEQRFGAAISIAALVVALVIGLTLVRMRRWLRVERPKTSPSFGGSVVVKDAYDDRIDAELESLD